MYLKLIADEYFQQGLPKLKPIKLNAVISNVGLEEAIADGDDLEKIVIPSHVKEIGQNAFSRCIGLSKLTIENGVEKLGWASFMRCTALTSVVLPDSLKDLPSQVFASCTSLTDVTLPKHLENMEDNDFEKTPWGGGAEMTEEVDDGLPF